MKHVLIAVSVMALFLSSCQKDVVAPEEPIAEVQVESEATADDLPETAAPVYTSATTYVNSNVSGFWQAVPARYSQTSKKYPLLLFIHGIGELGTGITRVNCCGLPKELNKKTFPAQFTVNGVNYSFIVIAPQFKVRPSAADMQSVIDFAKKRWRVDETRVYIAGMSMGGGSTWDYSAVYGQNVAAAVPVCAGTKPTTTLAKNVASKNLPVWNIHSYTDDKVPVQWAIDWMNWIKDANPTIATKNKLTLWNNVSHNSTWDKAFSPQTKVDGRNIYEWMLLYKRAGGTVSGPTNPDPSPTPTPTPSNPSSGNTAPIAVAGPDQSIPLSWNYMPLLNGTASYDPDGYLVSIKWSQVSGPTNVTFTSTGNGKVKPNSLVAGTYTFRVTVTDNKGATATDDMKVTMTGTGGGSTGGESGSGSGISNPVAGNTAPVAVAGPDQSIPLSWNYMPLLNGTASYDPDGYLVSIKWSQVSGPTNVTFTSTGNGKVKPNSLVAGTYVFRVTVTDNKGTSNTDDVQVTMTGSGSSGGSTGGSSGSGGGISNPVAGNTAPVAVAGPNQTIPLSWNYMPLLNGTASYDPDGYLVSIKWSQVSGPTSTYFTSTGNGKVKPNNLKAGTYTFRVTVTDNRGTSNTKDMTVTMTNN